MATKIPGTKIPKWPESDTEGIIDKKVLIDGWDG
jgi:hypothetical protein